MTKVIKLIGYQISEKALTAWQRFEYFIYQIFKTIFPYTTFKVVPNHTHLPAKNNQIGHYQEREQLNVQAFGIYAGSKKNYLKT
jgi:hypothetical protein